MKYWHWIFRDNIKQINLIWHWDVCLSWYKCRRYAPPDKHTLQLNKWKQKAKVLVNVTHFRFLLFFVSSLFYYGKQIFFVVKVKVHVAFCDNPWQRQNYLFFGLVGECKKHLNHSWLKCYYFASFNYLRLTLAFFWCTKLWVNRTL